LPAFFFVAAFLADLLPAVLAADFHGFAARCVAADFLVDFLAAFAGFLPDCLTVFFTGAFALAFGARFRWVMA
jgi:hypothetical protein